MTNEQRVRVDRLERYLITDREKTYTTVRVNDLDTALSLIKEQQEEIEGLKNKEVLIKRYFKKCDLIKQKDKQIELMAKYWNTGLAMCDNCDRIVEKYEKNNCKDCIKQYFADKAKIEQ